VFVLSSLRRPRCRGGFAYAGMASPSRQVVVALNDAGDGRCVGFNIVSGGGGESEERKTGYDKCHSPFLRRTARASHFLGLPLCYPSPIPPSSKYVPAHIPLERGGAGAAVVRSANPGVFVIEPTSLERGEGLVAGFLRVVGTELRCRGGGWW
jgi:hypothetical protein